MSTPALIPHLTPCVAPADQDALDVFLVDVDGTVALCGDRDPYDETTVLDALPNTSVIVTVQALIRIGYEPIFMSGRTEACRRDTERWLLQYVFRLPMVTPKMYSRLYMRAVGDIRPDCVIKLDMFNEHIRDRYNVLLAIDDRNQVVRLWRSLGITCLQVADGDF
jgi:hypothetical protein